MVNPSSVIDIDPTAGMFCSKSLFPQYLIRAMLGWATAAACMRRSYLDRGSLSPSLTVHSRFAGLFGPDGALRPSQAHAIIVAKAPHDSNMHTVRLNTMKSVDCVSSQPAVADASIGALYPRRANPVR